MKLKTGHLLYSLSDKVQVICISTDQVGWFTSSKLIAVSLCSSFQYLPQERDLRRWPFDLGTWLIMHVLYENWQVGYNWNTPLLYYTESFSILICLMQVFYTFVSCHIGLLVSCPDYFLHAEGKSSLVNYQFNFCSMHHDGGIPMRLLHANDVMYCNGW